MKAFLSLTIGTLLLILAPVTYAQQTNISLDEDDYEACLQILRLPKSIATKGTYKLRMDQCIDQRVHAREFGYNSENDRLTQRVLRTQTGLSAGTIRAPVQSQDIRRYLNPRQNISTDVVTSIEDRLNARLQKSFLKDFAEKQITNVYYERPSRRSIKDRAYSQTREDKQLESEVFQSRWNEAVHECSAITNNFTRTNCIRGELRRLGAQ